MESFIRRGPSFVALVLCLWSVFFGSTPVAAVAALDAVVLTNDDFRFGTVVIDRPGVYRLGEDILFDPNSPEVLGSALASGELPLEVARTLGLPLPPARVEPHDAGAPLPTQFTRGGPVPFAPGGPLAPRYDPAAFGLGFFAAIVITADGVELDLNGHRIEQSPGHALLQRFFSVIELAGQPFVPGQGPADFGDTIRAARRVEIHGGTIGRSAHHGIHGNGNFDVTVKNVHFEDFEVAAVALNSVERLTLVNLTARSREDVPVLGTFSSARFIAPYLDYLVRAGVPTVLETARGPLDVETVRGRLRLAVNRVYSDVVDGVPGTGVRGRIDADRHPEEYALFHNPFGVVDGNAYGFVVNGRGVAVNGFPRRPERDGSRHVFVSNVEVLGLAAAVTEVPTLDLGSGPVLDPVGAVFQVRNRHPDTGGPVTVTTLDDANARYVGNPVADAQLIVAKAHHEGWFDGASLDLSRLSIGPDVVAWAEGRPAQATLAKLTAGTPGYLCNGDSMFHVNKGVVGFKMDAVSHATLVATRASNLVNLGGAGTHLCGDYGAARSHPLATLPGYGGTRVRGYSFAGAERVIAVDAGASDLFAAAGEAIGFDVMTDTRRFAAFRPAVTRVATGAGGAAGPNPAARAIAFRIGHEADRVRFRRACAAALDGADGDLVVDADRPSAAEVEPCRAR